ncbi:MAG: hypothetical protein GY759_09090 [Chloroflexi bacterium]|nr:hypothetical protein [Chloroflexota bacterium]
MTDYYACDYCEIKWSEEKLHTVRDLFERVQPGDEMPVGQCPTCGVLINLEDKVVLPNHDYLVVRTTRYNVRAGSGSDAVQAAKTAAIGHSTEWVAHRKDN